MPVADWLLQSQASFLSLLSERCTARGYRISLQRYFPGRTLVAQRLSDNEYYAPRKEIAALFGYRLWSDGDLPVLLEKATLLARTDVTPAFLLTELMSFLIGHRIVRPGYTTLQDLISEALSTERRRLGGLLRRGLDDAAKAALAQLLVRDDTLSELAALKQDAKDFGWRQMARSARSAPRWSRCTGSPRRCCPSSTSRNRICTITRAWPTFYTVYDLRRLKAEQTHLYLLCYAWQRYRQLTDNLVDALATT